MEEKILIPEKAESLSVATVETEVNPYSVDMSGIGIDLNKKRYTAVEKAKITLYMEEGIADKKKMFANTVKAVIGEEVAKANATSQPKVGKEINAIANRLMKILG